MKSTFPFISAPLARPAGRRRVAPFASRGFTLIEMMVVVVIIAISAAIAVPGISKRMKSNRTKITAEKVAIMYRQARIRAMGRSSAVLVRYEDGAIQVLEGIQGTSATATGCSRLPESSCLLPASRWNNRDRSQVVEQADHTASGDFSIVLTEADGTVSSDFDVCFTPSGRTYSRNVLSNRLGNLSGPLRLEVDRTDGVGFARSVIVSPSGGARVVASP